MVNARRYSTLTLCESGTCVNRAYLEMGSRLTWHGSSDGRADWAPLHFVKRSTGDTDSESESSSGGKTTFEAKAKFTPPDLDQFLAQAVVSSHIHYN